MISDSSIQRQSEVDGGEIEYTSGTPNEITPETDAIGLEFYDFYRTARGQLIPEGEALNTTTKPTLASNNKFMNFYPFSDINAISPRPMLFISGDRAHSRDFSEDAYALAAEPKELFWVPGAGHVDLERYDPDRYWSVVLPFLAGHLRRMPRP